MRGGLRTLENNNGRSECAGSSTVAVDGTHPENRAAEQESTIVAIAIICLHSQH